MEQHPVVADVGTAERTSALQHRWPLFSGLAALALVIAGGLLIAIRQFRVVPYAVDDAWMDALVEVRAPFLDQVARNFDQLGGGVVGAIVVPVVVAAVLLVLRRWWATLYFLAASLVSAVLVQLIKNLVDRPRPEEILVAVDFGSFPSGHAANAATIAVVLGIVLRRRWVWVLGALWVVGMMLSRNYLGAHWLTDTVGGLILGVGVALALWAPFSLRLYREHILRRAGESEAEKVTRAARSPKPS
jgi:membrane-associated phospholipid phosphatase